MAELSPFAPGNKADQFGNHARLTFRFPGIKISVKNDTTARNDLATCSMAVGGECNLNIGQASGYWRR